MSHDEFRLAVLGDEPAGLWLLGRYHATMVEREEPQRTAWVSVKPGPRLSTIPSAAATEYGITTGPAWSVELVSPERSLLWSPEGIAEAYPLLKPDADGRAIRETIRRQPDVLTHAGAIWRALGRTQGLTPENAVRAALQATSLAHWDATRCVPAETERFAVDAADNPIEEVEALGSGALSLKLRNQPPIVAHRWILNLTVHQLARLASRSVAFNKLMSVAADMRSRSALYPLYLRVAPEGVPCPVRPLTVFLDTETIPDLETEAWPIELAVREADKVLTLWASAPQAAGLEAILDRFRQGMARLNHLFPFLPSRLHELSTALDLESCAQGATRAAALDELEALRCEHYDLTTFHTATRHPGLLALMPFVNCHLPYPMGTLHAARTLLPALVGKKKKKPAEAEAKPPETGQSP